MENKLWKRGITLVLAFVMMCTSINVNWAVETPGKVDGNGIAVTDGQIVAFNYKESLGLTNEEVAVLSNESLLGNTHNMTVPASDSDLITVDSTKREITAKEYVDTYKNTWKAVSASIVYEGGPEVIELEKGKGSFAYAGKNYSVDVTYQVTVAVNNQETLVNAPYYLAKGVENLELLANDCSSYLMLMETIVPQMMVLVDGSLFVSLEEGSSASEAIKALNNQIKTKGTLELMNHLEGSGGYLYASSKTEYLLTKGAAVKSSTMETYEYVKAIAESEGINTILTFAGNVPAYATQVKQLKRAMAQFELLVEAMTPVYNDPWKALDATLVQEKPDYASLDPVVMAAIGESREHVFEPVTPLVAASTVVTCNVNRYDVTVNVKASTIPTTQADDNTLVPLEDISIPVTVPGNATKAEILSAIEQSNVEGIALDTWNCDISTDSYNRAVTALPDRLTENISYTITYTPKVYKLSFAYDSTLDKEVYYGYNHTLEVAADVKKAYDYHIGKDTYMQGERYRVVSDTEITRVEGKARGTYRINELVAQDYAETLTSKEVAILQSAAVKSDTIDVRVVDNENTDQIVIEDHTITAKDYDAGYDDLQWKPFSANVVKGGQVVESTIFVNNTTEITTTDYEYVEVVYHLTIKSGDNATVRGLLNLPNALVLEAKGQKADMDELLADSVYGNLGSINKTMLNAMGGNLGEESKEAIDAIKAQAFNEATGKLYLYEYLTAYKRGGLTYYYQDGNSARIKEQVTILANQLAVVARDDLLPPLLDDLGYGSYKDKIDTVVAQLEAMKSGFAAPNEAINAKSPQLSALVALLEQEGEVGSYQRATGLKMKTTLTEAASNAALFNIEVSILTGDGQLARKETTSISYEKGAVIADNTVLYNALGELEKSLQVDPVHYTCQTLGEIPEKGYVMNGSMTVKYTWTPKSYFVSIQGTDIVLPFTYDNAVIVLPLCEEANRAYVYTIADRKVEATVNNNRFAFTKEFTTEEFDALFAQGSNLEITRAVEDVNRRDILALVDSLNKALIAGGMVDGNGNMQMAFIPMDRNGNVELVLRMTPGAADKLTTAFPSLATAMMTSKYGYIGMGGKGFIEEGMVSVQAVVDMLLANEGFGTNTVLNVIDENGNINEMYLENAAVIGQEENTIWVSNSQIPRTDLLGGKILETVLQFGIHASAVSYEVPLYITIEDFDLQASTLRQQRANIEQNKETLTLECKDNVMTVYTTLPDEQFATILGAWLFENQESMSDISKVYLRQLLEHNKELLGPILNNSQVGTKTFENTLAKMGKVTDLSSKDGAIVSALDSMRVFYEDLELKPIKSQRDTYRFDGVYSLKELLDETQVQESLRNLIVEKDSGVTIPMQVTMSNMTKDYEALILDNSKAGMEKLTITENLAAAMETAGSSAIVTLLNPVDGDIHFGNTAILNLNGKTINGNLTSDAKVMVIDNTCSKSGAVTGTVTGMFQIFAGNYLTNVTAMLPTGYEQAKGSVQNSYYDLEKDAHGNYTIFLAPDYLSNQQPVALKYLATEMAVDFALNTYLWANLSVDDSLLYSPKESKWSKVYVQSNDSLIHEAVEYITVAGIEQLANRLLAQLTDFAKVAECAKNQKPIATYNIAATPWDLQVTVEGEGDNNYIDATMAADAAKATIDRTLSLEVAGTDTEVAQLVALNEKLAQVVNVNEAKIGVNALAYNDGTLSIDTTAVWNVREDFSVDDNYAITMGVIAANALTDNTEMVAAVNEALSDSKSMKNLVEELEKLTVEQLLLALKNAKGVNVAVMAESLGIKGITAQLEEDSYQDVLYMGYALTNRYGIPAAMETLGSLKVEEQYATYKREYTNSNGLNVSLEVVLCTEDGVPVPSPSPTPLPTLPPLPTPSPTPEPTVTLPPVPTPGPTPTYIPSESVKPSESVEPSESVGPTESVEPSESVGPTESVEPSESVRPTESPGPSPSDTPKPTKTPSPSPTPTRPVVSTPRPTPTPTPAPPAKISASINLAQNKELFYGGEIKGTTIYIDARCEGVNVKQLIQNMVMFHVENGSLDYDKTKFTKGIKDGLVTNGAMLKVVAENADGKETNMIYKIILKGDVNCDGKTNSTDAVLLSDYCLGYSEAILAQNQLLAADMDCEESWNNTDAVLIGDKFFGYDYVSSLTYH